MTDQRHAAPIHERIVLNGAARFRVVRAEGAWRVEYLAEWDEGGPEAQGTFDTLDAAVAECNARAAKADVLWSTYLGNVLEGNS